MQTMSLLASVYTGALGLEKGDKVADKRRPVAPEHFRALHFEQDAREAETRQEEQEIRFSLQPFQFPLIPLLGPDAEHSFPLIMDIVASFIGP